MSIPNQIGVKMSKRKSGIVLMICALAILPATAQQKSDKERDGLFGPVDIVRREGGFFDEKNGKYVESERYHIQTVKYARNGRKLHQTLIGICGNDLPRKPTFDDKGNMTEEAIYYPDGSVWGRYVHKYDLEGKRIESKYYDGSGVNYRTWIYTYKYDSYGNWVKQVSSMKPGVRRGRPK
jgi:hypothetical protein